MKLSQAIPLFLLFALLAAGCDRGGWTPPVIQTQKQAEKSGVSGIAFIKLNRGTEPLAGLEVCLYPESQKQVLADLVDEVARARTDAELLKKRVDTLNRTVEIHQQALADAASAETALAQWNRVLTQCQLTRHNFIQNGYNSFSAYDPIRGRMVSYQFHSGSNWEHWKAATRDELTRFVDHCTAKCDEIRMHLDTLNESIDKLQIDSVAAELKEAHRKIDEDIAMQRTVPELVRYIAGEYPPAERLYADEDGRFAVELPPGDYILAASAPDSHTRQDIAWWMPVTVTEGKMLPVVLTQTSATDIAPITQSKP